MKTTDFDYALPPGLIAQEPAAERDASRMLVLDRADGRIEHRVVRDLPRLLRAGDLLVVNNTRVFPARVFGRRADTGGRVELLLVEPAAGGGPGDWVAFYRASRRPRPGLGLLLAGRRVRGEVRADLGDGRILARLEADADLFEVLEKEGVPPVPPYIRRQGGDDALTTLDRERYQTVYARHTGAVAAPTAGLHFTNRLLAELAAAGIGRTEITLHVGPGTFRPVKCDDVADHVMEEERYSVDPGAAAAIARARAGAGRVVAVGSTSVRTLETAAGPDGAVRAGAGRTSLFIRPPHAFRAVDALLTNFHLPRSTLLMMVCAFAGTAAVLRAYREAVAEGYRFYSYGDCMLVL